MLYMLALGTNKQQSFHTLHTLGFMTCLMQLLFPPGRESNLGPLPHITSLFSSSFPVSQIKTSFLRTQTYPTPTCTHTHTHTHTHSLSLSLSLSLSHTQIHYASLKPAKKSLTRPTLHHISLNNSRYIKTNLSPKERKKNLLPQKLLRTRRKLLSH